MKEMKNRVIR